MLFLVYRLDYDNSIVTSPSGHPFVFAQRRFSSLFLRQFSSLETRVDDKMFEIITIVHFRYVQNDKLSYLNGHL